MAIDLATLAALGILPSGGMALPGAADQIQAQAPLGASLFPVQDDGTDPLAPLPDAPKADEASDSKGPFGQPWRSDALLALGAGLLSGRNFFDGLSKGA